jgi:heat shock protein HslJ
MSERMTETTRSRPPALVRTLVAALAGLTLAACSDGGGASSTDLLGQWRLSAQMPAGGGVQTPPAGTAFSVTFAGDGTVGAVADCNRCGGGFTAGDHTIDVGVMACTRAYCTASAPFDSTYAELLQSASAWRVEGSALTLDGPAGTMTFVR